MNKEQWLDFANNCLYLHELLIKIAAGKGAPIPYDRKVLKMKAAEEADKELTKLRDIFDNLMADKELDVNFFGAN